jgi:hypothetical protein
MFLTFRGTQNPDRLDTFDFDKLTLKIIKIGWEIKNYAILINRLDTFELFEYKNSCLVIFWGHFVILTLFWPKNSR